MRRLRLALAAWLVLAGWLLVPPLSGTAHAREDFVYGVIVDSTDPRSMALAREAGFTHAKMIIFWDRLEPARGRYLWNETEQNDFDNVLKAARSQAMKLIIRVDGVPDWAGGAAATADLEPLEAFYRALAEHGRGTVVAYEILNEPNLP